MDFLASSTMLRQTTLVSEVTTYQLQTNREERFSDQLSSIRTYFTYDTIYITFEDEDVKMRKCENVPMCKCVNVKKRKCENVKEKKRKYEKENM